MSLTKKMTKDAVIKSLIQNLKKDGFKNIKANIKGHTSPDKVSYKWTQKAFSPDLTAEDGAQNIHFYQIHLKILKSEIQEYFQQWILFNSVAQSGGGVFTIVVPEENHQQIEKLITDKKINAKVIPAESI